MKWIEIKIRTTSEASDAISEMLMSNGAGGVAIEDPEDIRREIFKAESLDYADEHFLNSLGEDVVIKAYFPGDRNIVELSGMITEKINFISNFLQVGKGFAGYSEIDEEDWSTAWKKYYKPLPMTDRIIIKPSWEEYPAKEGDIVIELDPGMAFGTGTHETTRMCGQLLEKYLKPGDTVLDVGCGTGILSIIAAKLGASRVTAVDIDEMAVRIAGENCERNGVGSAVDVHGGILQDIPQKKHAVVVANIISKVILELSGILPHYLMPGGLLIASGIIRERKQDVLQTYEKLGFVNVEAQEMGEWVAMVFKCQDFL